MKKKIFVILVMFVLFSTASNVEAVQPYFSLGFTSGGAEFGTVKFSSGTSEKITAGGEFYLVGGVTLSTLNSESFETDIGIGIHTDSAQAENGEVSFERQLAEVIQYYKASEKLRLGGGLTYHLNPVYKCDLSGGICSDKVEFKNALGFTLQADYNVTGNLILGIRHTNINYDFDNINGIPVTGSIDGSHAGIILRYSFK